MRLTEWPWDSRWEQRAACWVDLPARSRPSITIKAPLELGAMVVDSNSWVFGVRMLVGCTRINSKSSVIEIGNASVAKTRYLGREAAYGIQLCYHGSSVFIPYCLHMFN